MGMSAAERIGVRIIWTTTIKITEPVRCPIGEASPSPRMNPTAASSSIHSPARAAVRRTTFLTAFKDSEPFSSGL
jgi:hypothetical protein